MKTLILVRHAKSSWDNPTLRDIDRPLNDRGRADAPSMAERLKQEGYNPELLITSNAVRAHQTSIAFAEVFKLDESKLIIEPSLYHGDIEEFIHSTLLIDESVDVAALFGHNPGITFFANVVCEANIENVPTCGVLVIKSSSKTWADTDISDLKLEKFIYPKENG